MEDIIKWCKKNHVKMCEIVQRGYNWLDMTISNNTE